MQKVYIESPYGLSCGLSPEENVQYAKKCANDSLTKGEAPFAHQLFLYGNNLVVEYDNKGKEMSRSSVSSVWRKAADKNVVYTDMGISTGMILGIDESRYEDQKIECRGIEGEKCRIKEVYACGEFRNYRLYVENGIVSRARPDSNWMVGKNINAVLEWMFNKNFVISDVTPYRQEVAVEV